MFQPGDKVLVYSTSYDKRPAIGTVARITKTMAILGSGNRYSLSSGSAVPYEIGGGHIEALTDERLNVLRYNARIRSIRSAIGAYVAAMKPEEIEWLYILLREEHGMPEVAPTPPA